MDRLRVRRPSRFLQFIISSCADACGPNFIFICTDLYYWIPIILVAGIVILPFVPIYLPLPPPQTIRRDLYPPFLSLSLFLLPLFSFTFTFSLLVAATKLSAKGGDLRPPLPDSSTSNRLIHRLKSFFNNRCSSLHCVGYLFDDAAQAIVRSLSFPRYILDIMLISRSNRNIYIYRIGIEMKNWRKQFLFVSFLNMFIYVFISDYYLYSYYPRKRESNLRLKHIVDDRLPRRNFGSSPSFVAGTFSPSPAPFFSFLENHRMPRRLD